MMIKIGILGYGNLGKGVECAIKHNPDMELKAVFTRRDPSSLSILTEGAKVYSVADAPAMKDEIDVLIICGGSATDLPKQTPEMAKYFNVIDSFDTHAKIPEHFEAVDKAAKESGHIGLTRQKHTRECFVVAEEGADLKKIEEEIVTMPNYFADYDTTVHFISEEELLRDHAGIPHGGFVIRTGKTGWNNENSHVIEYSLKLDSNPEFTSSVLAAYARAAYRLSKEGQTGCKTVFDIAPAYLAAEDGAYLRKHML